MVIVKNVCDLFDNNKYDQNILNVSIEQKRKRFVV